MSDDLTLDLNKISDSINPSGDVPSTALKAIRGAKELKIAVMDTISRMQENENTHAYMLYFLRALDSPGILIADINYLDEKEKLRRKTRQVTASIKDRLISLMGIVIPILIGMVVTFLFSLV